MRFPKEPVRSNVPNRGCTEVRRLVWAVVLVCALGASAAFAQTPAPLAWDEAELSWTPPAEYGTGGSLADCAAGPCTVWYVVEANAPGGNGWGPIAIVNTTTYRAVDLWPGTWSFRVRAFFRLTGYSPFGPVVAKTVVLPIATAPPTVASK